MSKVTETEKDITEMCDALIKGIEEDHERICKMYTPKGEASLLLSKGYLRSIMIIEEAKARWLAKRKDI